MKLLSSPAALNARIYYFKTGRGKLAQEAHGF